MPQWSWNKDLTTETNEKLSPSEAYYDSLADAEHPIYRSRKK